MTGPGSDDPSGDSRGGDGPGESESPGERSSCESGSESESTTTDPSSSTRDDSESSPETGTPTSKFDPSSIEPNDDEGSAVGRATRQSESPRAPDPEPGSKSAKAEPVTIEDDGVVRWFLETDDGTLVAIRDVLSSVAVVALIGLVLFGISGVWPPLVAVESPSMEPNMKTGDLVFVVDEGRFVGDSATGDTGVVTYTAGANGGHEKFSEPGDVIIFKPDGREDETPVIDRAHFWVEEGDNWVDEQADPEHLSRATSCEQISACEARHDGFVTKGDGNPAYDQAGPGSGATTDVVKPEWIIGKAAFRSPWLGHVRLTFDDLLVTGSRPVLGTVIEPASAASGTAPSTPDSRWMVPLTAMSLGGIAAGSLVVANRWREQL